MEKIGNRKVYYGVDAMKLVCAVLVVFWHSYRPDKDVAWANFVLYYLTKIAVPFFFVASGFFYAKGLMRAEDPKAYFRKYFVRVLQMYLFWTIITIPLQIMTINTAHGDYSLLMKVVYFIRTVVLCGSLGIYWYVLALVYNSVTLYFVYVKHWEKAAVAVAVILWMIGMYYDSGLNDHNNILNTVIYAGFGSNRTFWSTGLIYMLIGYMMAKHESRLPRNAILMLAVFVAATVLRYVEYNYTPMDGVAFIFQASSLFLLSLNLNMEFMKDSSKDVRKLSTAIYLLQFPFLLLFDFHLRRPIMVDLITTLVVCSLVYFVLKKVLPSKWVSIMFGN